MTDPFLDSRPVVNASRDVDAADSSNRGARGRPERERSGRTVSWAAQYEELRDQDAQLLTQDA
jgi:hypothetical protein